jgi:dihydroorotate dehydrogenase (fumarate)
MPDLSTTYLGLKLRTPLVSSASPLTQDIDSIRHLEDAGASAIVFHSLFEEAAEGSTLTQSALDRYLTLLHGAKCAVSVPVIGSLCATTLKGWIDYATQIEQAGASALELNLYQVPSQKDVSGSMLEDRYVEFVKAAKSAVKIPVAAKLTHSSPA